jgi:hypothetical protein
MALVVGRRPLIAEIRVPFKTRPCRIGGGEKRTGTDVSVNTSLCISVSLEIFTVICFNYNCILEWSNPWTVPALPVYGTEQQKEKRCSGQHRLYKWF